MTGNDDVDGGIHDTLDERQPVVFAAQRRRKLEERPVRADIVFIQHEMIDRNPARDRQALLLGAADHVERLAAGDLRRVIARPGKLDEPQVAFEHDDFGGCRYSGQAQSRRHLACVHHSRR